MNERIQELASAADVWCDQNWLGHDLYNQRWEEKFAELIIRDCVQQCESLADIAEQINSGELARRTKATAQSCGKMIKMRFGLE